MNSSNSVNFRSAFPSLTSVSHDAGVGVPADTEYYGTPVGKQVAGDVFAKFLLDGKAQPTTPPGVQPAERNFEEVWGRFGS